MRRLLAIVLTVGLTAAACGDDDTVMTTAAPSTSVPETSTTTPPPTTATTEADDPVTPPVEPGTLASLTEGRVEDPLMGSGFHQLVWADDAHTVLVSRRSTTGAEGDADLLVLASLDPAPAVGGLDPDQVLVRVRLEFFTGDVVPWAVVVYSPGADRWEATTVIDEASVEAALLETTDYAAAAPDGPAVIDLRLLTFNAAAGTFSAVVTVVGFGESEVAYEGEIECDLGAGGLACVTLSDDGVLRPGDEGEAVEALQDALKTAGYFTAAVDGKYGPMTTAAVEAFQTDYLLGVDGKAGPQTVEMLAAVVEGTTDLVLVSKDGIGSVPFGTASDAAYSSLVAMFGPADAVTGWYVDACDGHDWYKASWDGFTAVFTDRNGTRQLDGWEILDLGDLPPNLLIAGGIESDWTWEDFDEIGADFISDYLGDRWRHPGLGYTNGRFVDPVTDPPAPDSAILRFGTGTGGFESC